MTSSRALLLALAGCALIAACGAERPATQQDVVDGLVRDFLVPLGDVQLAPWPSDCRTDGETDAAVAAALFAAFLAANADAAVAVALPERLKVDASGMHPRLVSARQGAPVVAVSNAGVLGVDALVCVEVYGVRERAFFVMLGRGGDGTWSVRREIEVWSELAPEELPDGELYR